MLQIQSLERGLDGRALPIEVRAGNVFFLDPATGQLPPFAPTLVEPVHRLHASRAPAPPASTSSTRTCRARWCTSSTSASSATSAACAPAIDGIHNVGRHFLIGRTVGEVFNPVVGGPDRVVNIESSAETQYDALLLSADAAVAGGHAFRLRLHAGQGLQLCQRRSDSVPERTDRSERSAARIRPDAERSPAPLRRVGQARLPGGVDLGALWTISSGVPMDIMMPDGQSRVPVMQRNAGGRQFETRRGPQRVSSRS